jgi:transcriptional regulator with XRE-family HTH domain
MATKNAKPKAKAKTQMDFGERLAGFRKEKGLTQQALAELINLHVIHSATKAVCHNPRWMSFDGSLSLYK